MHITFCHGGSSRQVRSLGSLLQNKTEQHGAKFHFDTFALDFNEELTAFNFEYVILQSEFLLASIQKIWSLYSTQPFGIVLIGHSMGGIVIQAAARNRNFDKNKISFSITFATPYAEPPFYFDTRYMDFWKQMNTIDRNNANVNVISISGGLRDEFIDESWTNASFLRASFHSATVDRVWLEMDHKCILWCNQLVRQTSRLLFDYALNPVNFMQNFDEHVLLHYQSIGRKFIPRLSSHPIQHFDFPKTSKKIRVNETIMMMNYNGQFVNHFLLALSKDFGKKDATELLYTYGCGYEQKTITRYLDHSHMFIYLNMTECDIDARVEISTNFWILAENHVLKSRVQIDLYNTMLSHIVVKFTMKNSPLAIIPVEFGNSENDLCIYQVRIDRRTCRKGKCLQRVFFMRDNLIRRVDEIKTNNENGQQTLLLIYFTGNKMAKHKITIIDTCNCEEYAMEISVNVPYSFIKALRRTRHILPFSFVILAVIINLYCEKSIMLTGVLLSLLSIIIIQVYSNFLCTTFIILFTITLFLLFFLFITIVFRPLLTIISKKITTFNRYPFFATVQIGFATILSAFTFYTSHTFMSVLFCVITNLIYFNKLCRDDFHFVSVSMLHITFITLQIPSSFTYFWDVINYGKWKTSFDVFLFPNCQIIVLTLILNFGQNIVHFIQNQYDIDISQKISVFFSYRIIEFIVIIEILLLLYRNPLCFFVFTDITSFIVIFLIYCKIKI